MGKTGLVLEGGGLRGIFTAGVLDAFMELGIAFPYVVGVSAGACNAVSYVSGQAGRCGRVILDNFMDPRYLGPRNLLLHGSIFGMQFMFDEIPNRRDLFDYAAYDRSAVEFEAGVTSLLTGNTEFCGKQKCAENGFLAVQASSSIPLLARTVWIDGRPYLDGAVGDSIPVGRALEKGCGRVVVVLTQPRGFVKRPMPNRLLRRLRYARYPAFIKAMDDRHVMYNDTLRRIDELERAGKALVIAPARPCAFSSFEKSPEKMRAMYEEGLQAARERAEEIRLFQAAEAAGEPR